MEQLTSATIDFIESHLNDTPSSLALQAAKYPEVDMKTAIVQIAGRQVAKHKIPSWYSIKEIRYPLHLSMEQCSGENTARYKASLAVGSSLTDLTGGFGVDCSFMAQDFKEAHYVERQETLCEIAENNFKVLGENQIHVHHADSVEYLQQMKPVEWIFIDPARRDSKGGKTVVIADCEPEVAQLERLLLEKASKVMIKLSPMLDLSLALNTLNHVHEAHIISSGNECKELLLILKREKPVDDIPVYCINLLPDGMEKFVFTRSEEQNAICQYAATPLKYLYEPNASIMKAGAFRSVAQKYRLDKLHINSHLYTSDTYCADFPGRIFEVTDYCGFNKKELKTKLGGQTKANIAVRNFPASVAEIRKRTKLTEGGDLYLFATTLADDSKVMIFCRKPTVQVS